jgi:hypothetical protein
MTVVKPVLVVCVTLLLVIAAAGCPRTLDGTTKLTTVFTAAQAPKAAYAVALLSDEKNLDLSEIESLYVTVTEVVLDSCVEDEEVVDELPAVKQDDLEEVEDTPEDDGCSKVSVFTGAVDVNLLDLMGVSEILSSVDVPAGSYKKIRISIENPRLVLVSDPETIITDVHLTANGRLFISEEFELLEGEQNLLVLDFGGIHLVELGNGGFVLTPQLQADLQITSAVAETGGTIESVDETTGMVVLALADGTVEVIYTGAAIYLPTDTDTPTGTVADLQPGVDVEVQGTLFVDGSITATAIYILPAVQ